MAARFGISVPWTWPLMSFQRRMQSRIAGKACEGYSDDTDQYVNEYRDRHGKVRRYFRRPGGRAIPLPGLPGSIEFMAAYQAALAVVSPPPPSPKHIIAGSLAAAAAGYLRSPDFANLSPSSQ